MVRIVNGTIVQDGEVPPHVPSSSEQSITSRIRQPVNLCGCTLPAYSLGLLAFGMLLLFGVPGLIIFGFGVGGSILYTQQQQQQQRSQGAGNGRFPGFGRGQIRGVGDLPRPPPSS